MAKFDSYVICTSPRSGSTLLCRLLTATGVAGNPDSYFHESSISGWLAGLDLAPEPSLPEPEIVRMVLQAARGEGTLDTGIFGLRLQRHSFDFFIEKMAMLYPGRSSDAELLRAVFGRTLFVHLTRCDKVEQAVSYVKAQQSGLWHLAPDGTEIERLSPPRMPAYDEVEIRAKIAELTSDDQKWESWFIAEKIDPVRITYEELSNDPVESVGMVLGRLGLERQAAEGIEPGVAKMADHINFDWATRFRSE